MTAGQATRRRHRGRSAPRVTSVTTAQTLREQTVGVRLSFRWLGIRRRLRDDQLRRARAVFQAAEGSLSASKKLLNTRHPAWRAVVQAKRRLIGYWRAVSLPYPETATRLLRRDWIEDFELKMDALKADLIAARTRLDVMYAELLGDARNSLGELYDHDDYPPSLAGEFDVTWDYPSLEPPDYLQKLKPELYEAEAARVAARFDEALRLAEQSFAEEFACLVEGLQKSLAPAPGRGGAIREFKPGAVTKLREFFDRFRQINVHGSGELDALIAQGRAIVDGAGSAAADGEHGDVRTQVAQSLASIREQLGKLVQDRPRRRVVRGNRNPNSGSAGTGPAAPEPKDSGLFAGGVRQDGSSAEEAGRGQSADGAVG
jgi:hypothetical protein